MAGMRRFMQDWVGFGLMLRWKQAIIRAHVALKMSGADTVSRRSQVPKHFPVIIHQPGLRDVLVSALGCQASELP